MSIVVPIHDVAPYLAACLESLRAQTWRDFEVVMVDGDGDGDGDAAAVAARFAEEDRRFRLFAREGTGVGAARNHGVGKADGEYLVFLDGADLLPRHALETMAATLDSTGSDLVTGNVRCFTSRSVHPSRPHQPIFLNPRLRTHVTRHDVLLKDRQVTNKMWRRAFWDHHGLTMPEGVPHDDTFVALRGHFRAGSVDMTSVPVYLRREPEDRAAPDHASVRAIEDLVGSARCVRAFLADNGWGDRIDGWDRIVLRADLPAFLGSLRHGGDDYRERFLDLAGDYLSSVRPRVLSALPADRRATWELVRARRMGDLLEFLEWESAARGAARVRRRPHGYHLDPPVPLPSSATRLHHSELELVHKVDAVTAGDGLLVVEGQATLRHLGPARRLSAHLVEDATGERIKLPVTTFPALAQDWSGFRLVVDPAALPGRGGDWHVLLTAAHRGRRRSARLAESPGTQPVRGGAFETAQGSVWFSWTEAGGLRVQAGRVAAEVTAYRLDGNGLIFQGRLPASAGPTAAEAGPIPAEAGHISAEAGPIPAEAPQVTLVRTPGDVVRRCPAVVRGGTIEFAVDVRDLLPALGLADPRLDETASWLAEMPGAGPIRLAAPGARHAVGGRDLIVERAPTGHLRLREQPETLHLDRASWDHDGTLTLGGSLVRGGDGPAELVARHTGHGADVRFPVTIAGGRLRAELPVLRVPRFGGAVPVPAGAYTLSVRMDGRPLKLELRAPACAVRAGGRELELAAAGGEAGLKVGSDLAKEERGERRQRRLREVRYPRLRADELRDTVFFDSYTGRRFADSPRAICEELARRGTELDLLWNVRDGQVELPPGLVPVRTGSAAYYEALARSRYVITNTHLPPWFRRREGQVVVQTWHGTALKRIGFDIETVRFPRTGYKDRLRTEVGQWTHLLSPSPWATPVLRGAFRFEGEVVEAGYPRNDVLRRPEAAEGVRRRLGLPYGKKVVLYAPTWRDDEHANGRYRCEPRLDLARMARELGDEYVFLLRVHPNVTERPEVSGERVIDVSAYPDIQELFLVADVLVTDYSSAMFDFAVTGRPMLFHTYDLEHYRDTLRGFYFDFEAEAPGPLLRETGEVIAAVADLDEVKEKYAGLYADFARTFCPLDDGHAAARVVGRVFRDGQEAAWTSSSSSRE
ncbi:CDP-glycerol glycerophosphotransferase family protein [Nonomuraea sp. NPDC050790]|uniref:CDP-glycerol glycerophosphotransferase family protein n=1 Tax=Nonomuraea sp. NPDC050790 TaxID=3364371 RepID=UPI0037B73967